MMRDEKELYVLTPWNRKKHYNISNLIEKGG